MNLSFKSLWSRNPIGWSAIDMQGGVYGVNVRLPRQAGQKPTVLQHAAYPNQAVDAAVLAQMGRTLSPAKLDVVAVLDRQNYQIFMVDKPAVHQHEMESSLRLAVSPMIDYPVAEANLAWLDIPVRQTMGNRVPQLYVVVARTSLVDARKALFGQAKVRLDVVDIPESAQRNISCLLGSETAATCLIFADAHGVQLTVTYQGELYLVRYIGEALWGQPNGDNSDPFSQAIDRLALEIQRSLDFVRRSYPSININTLHVAPTAVDIGLADLLKSHLNEEVKSVDLSSLFDFPQGSDLKRPEIQAQYFHALGAALRIQNKG